VKVALLENDHTSFTDKCSHMTACSDKNDNLAVIFCHTTNRLAIHLTIKTSNSEGK
jgi:hypothetical protein